MEGEMNASNKPDLKRSLTAARGHYRNQQKPQHTLSDLGAFPPTTMKVLPLSILECQSIYSPPPQSVTSLLNKI
jgi:hypothetical protein